MRALWRRWRDTTYRCNDAITIAIGFRYELAVPKIQPQKSEIQPQISEIQPQIQISPKESEIQPQKSEIQPQILGPSPPYAGLGWE